MFFSFLCLFEFRRNSYLLWPQRHVFSWENSCLHCADPGFLARGLVSLWVPPCPSSECAGHWSLDKGCGWCTVCDRDSPLLCGCHHPVRGRACSPADGVGAGLVGPNQTPFPLSVCPAPKEVIAKVKPHTHRGMMCCLWRPLQLHWDAAQGHIPSLSC